MQYLTNREIVVEMKTDGGNMLINLLGLDRHVDHGFIFGYVCACPTHDMGYHICKGEATNRMVVPGCMSSRRSRK